MLATCIEGTSLGQKWQKYHPATQRMITMGICVVHHRCNILFEFIFIFIFVNIFFGKFLRRFPRETCLNVFGLWLASLTNWVDIFLVYLFLGKYLRFTYFQMQKMCVIKIERYFLKMGAECENRIRFWNQGYFLNCFLKTISQNEPKKKHRPENAKLLWEMNPIITSAFNLILISALKSRS